MRILHHTLETCRENGEVVVVIDVMRAFTTAAYAFGGGAEKIVLTGTVEDALKLKSEFPGSLTLGEVNGLRVPEFDLWNSPYEISGLDLKGKTLIQRTSSGTQGILRSAGAKTLLAGSFVVAEATLRYIQSLTPSEIDFVSTGVRGGKGGEEDIALDEYLTARLQEKEVNSEVYLKKVCAWSAERVSTDPEIMKELNEDLKLSMCLDHFDFALKVNMEDGLFVLRPVQLVSE